MPRLIDGAKTNFHAGGGILNDCSTKRGRVVLWKDWAGNRGKEREWNGIAQIKGFT